MITHHILLFVLSLLCHQSNSQSSTNVIQTHSGPVQGLILENVLSKKPYSSFKGIPYARPPMYEFRFKSPKEPEPWTSVLQATQHGDVCAQIRDDGKFGGTENCLYLNVYTPLDLQHQTITKDTKLKSVMVWIHGGAFFKGSGNSDEYGGYGPDFLLDQDVLVVTFNYRLGALGFLNVNHSQVSGNNGLRDQNMVLKWVQKNIANFGGNPRDVTIFGQSAGAVSVDAHLISKQSRGLFQKSMALSGSMFCPWASQIRELGDSQAVKLAYHILKRAGQEKETFERGMDEVVELLQEVGLNDIMKDTYRIISSEHLLDFKIAFVPSMEYPEGEAEPFIDSCFIEKFKTGDFHKGPHLMGFTNLETAESLSYFEEKWHSVKSWIKKNILRQRPKRAIGVEEKLNSTSDLYFVAAIDYKQQYMAADSSNPFYYRFSFDYSKHQKDFGPSKKILSGVRHTEDLLYVFYTPGAHQPLDQFNSELSFRNPNQVALTRHKVVKMLTNFAKYGTPEVKEPHIDISWPKSTKDGGYLDIGEKMVFHPNSRPVREDVVRIQDEYRKEVVMKEYCRPYSVNGDMKSMYFAVAHYYSPVICDCHHRDNHENFFKGEECTPFMKFMADTFWSLCVKYLSPK